MDRSLAASTYGLLLAEITLTICFVVPRGWFLYVCRIENIHFVIYRYKKTTTYKMHKGRSGALKVNVFDDKLIIKWILMIKWKAATLVIWFLGSWDSCGSVSGVNCAVLGVRQWFFRFTDMIQKLIRVSKYI